MSGLKIISATYGYGPNTVDLTNTIDGLVKDGQLQSKVNSDLLKNAGMVDPAPNEQKTLTLKYTVNDGEVNLKTYQDGNTINISAPSNTRSGLEIEKAEYSNGSNSIDVTNAVKSLVKKGSINLKVSPENLGITVSSSENYKLTVTYKLNGASTVDEIKNGETFSLSAPPQSGTGYNSSATSYTFTDSLFGFLTSTFGSVLYGLSVWLFAFAWYDVIYYNYSFKVGKIDTTTGIDNRTMSTIPAMIGFMFGLITSFPGFLLLLLFVFFRRFFMTTDLMFAAVPSGK